MNGKGGKRRQTALRLVNKKVQIASTYVVLGETYMHDCLLDHYATLRTSNFFFPKRQRVTIQTQSFIITSLEPTLIPTIDQEILFLVKCKYI